MNQDELIALKDLLIKAEEDPDVCSGTALDTIRSVRKHIEYVAMVKIITE